MPGLTGFFTRRRASGLDLVLQKMVASMMHETYYRSGTYVDTAFGAFIGWTVHPGSYADCMPLVSRDGKYVLVFSGEVFGDPMGPGLPAGNRCDGMSEASSVMRAYEARKEAMIPGLNGRFHGVVLDRPAHVANLFIDRFGMHRICLHETEDTLYFSTEAKAILAVCPEVREIDYRSLGEYVNLVCVMQNRTLFQGIDLMPGGSLYTYHPSSGVVARRRYFEPRRWEALGKEDPRVFQTRLVNALPSIFAPYLGGKQKVAMALTGGLDTRVILAQAKPAPGTLPCYSFGGCYRDCYDVRVARDVAEACGLTHTTLRLDSAFLKSFPQLAEKVVHVSDGNLEMSGVPNLYVNRSAREIAPVRIGGNWGSEVLRGYRAFKPSLRERGLFTKDFLPHVLEASDTYRQEADCHPLTFALFKQVPWYDYGRTSLEQTQVSVRSPYLDNELLALLYQAPPSMLLGNDLCLRLISAGNPALRGILTDRGVGGRSIFGLPGPLRVYRELLFKMDYYYGYGMPRWLGAADRSLSFLNLERLFLGRHKYYHLRKWFREEWAKDVREILLDPGTLSRSLYRADALERLVTEHIEGVCSHAETISIALAVELVHRLFIEG